MDFDDFKSDGTAASTTVDTGKIVQLAGFSIDGDDIYSSGQYAPGDQSNWVFAAGNVFIWSALVLIGSAVPVASFAASFNHTPQQQPDLSWRWSYNVWVGVKLYTAELHGEFIDDYNGTDAGVRWEMYISLDGEYTDFLWYYGESKLPATEGFWVLKDNPTDDNDLIQIDWERNLVDDTYSIQYTNILPGGPENGGYISFEATTDVTYDRHYDIYNKGQDNLTEIEWNSTTQEGRVKDVNHFGNDDWYCWDSNHLNTNCTA